MATIAWSSTGPTAAAAQAFLQRGELDRSERELEGLDDLGLSPEQSRATRAGLASERGRRADAKRLASVETLASLAAASAHLHEGWHDDEVKNQAIALYIQRAKPAIEDAWKAGRQSELTTLAESLVGLDVSLARRARGLADLHGAAACLSTADLACAATLLAKVADNDTVKLEHGLVNDAYIKALAAQVATWHAQGLDDTQTLVDRSASLAKAVELAEQYEKRVGLPLEGHDATSLARAKNHTDGKIAKALEAAQNQAEQDARAEQRRQAKAAAAAAAQRRTYNASRLRCRDGTLSPSCSCEGSHRGCCSRHGGVAGCG